jgi:hypothetical protein
MTVAITQVSNAAIDSTMRAVSSMVEEAGVNDVCFVYGQFKVEVLHKSVKSKPA